MSWRNTQHRQAEAADDASWTYREQTRNEAAGRGGGGARGTTCPGYGSGGGAFRGSVGYGGGDGGGSGTGDGDGYCARSILR